MTTVLVSPVSQKKPDGSRSPKDYPWWEELLIQLRRKGCHITQVAAHGDALLQNVNGHLVGLPITRVISFVLGVDFWISVDNFLPHALYFAAGAQKPGVVLWGPSDPEIYGYPENLNLSKGTTCFCGNQFGLWRDVDYDASRFMPPYCAICSMIERGFLER